MNPTTLKRYEIAKVLKRHRGSKVQLAKRAGVRLATVSGWLAGMTISANIAGHAQDLASELLIKESEDSRIAKGEANGPSVRTVIEQLRSKSKSQGE